MYLYLDGLALKITSQSESILHPGETAVETRTAEAPIYHRGFGSTTIQEE